MLIEIVQNLLTTGTRRESSSDINDLIYRITYEMRRNTFLREEERRRRIENSIPYL